ncbi:hypothetical protein ACS0TY_026128 [Phlomoides rotata]
MSAEMQRFGTSEEEDDVMGKDVKEEDDDDDKDEEKNMGTPSVVGVDVGVLSTGVEIDLCIPTISRLANPTTRRRSKI